MLYNGFVVKTTAKKIVKGIKKMHSERIRELLEDLGKMSYMDITSETVENIRRKIKMIEYALDEILEA